MDDTYGLWRQKNQTLSDKSAQKEYGITYKEIIDAIRAGELQYKEGNMHGNSWFRLLRVEVERLVEKKYGADYLEEKKVKKELSEINKELRALKKRVSELEERKKALNDKGEQIVIKIEEYNPYCFFCGARISETSSRTNKKVNSIFYCPKCGHGYCDQCSYSEEIQGKKVQLCLRCNSKLEKYE